MVDSAKPSPRDVPFGFAARIGAALVAPRRALAASDHPDAGGKSVTDIAALFGLTVAALYFADVVTALWILASGEIGGGLSSLVGVASRAISAELTLLVILAVGIALLAGRRRSLGRDLDLACTALVPLLALKVAAGLSFSLVGWHPGGAVTDALGMIGYGWAIGLAALAVGQARSRARDDADDAIEVPAARRAWRRVGWGALVLWGGLIAIHGAGIVRAPEQVRPVVSGDRAPAFELPVIGEGGTLGPRRVALDEMRGDVVVVEFWATWCGPCRASLPALERIRGTYEGDGVEVVAVNTEGPAAAAGAAAMLGEVGFGGISLSDDGRVADRYRVTTIPHLAVIDSEGSVALVHRGFPGASAYERKLRETIDALLSQR